MNIDKQKILLTAIKGTAQNIYIYLKDKNKYKGKRLQPKVITLEGCVIIRELIDMWLKDNGINPIPTDDEIKAANKLLIEVYNKVRA